MVEGHHMGPRYPIGPDPNHQQRPYMGPMHGPSLGPRPMALQPGPPPEASMYPSHHRPDGHNMHPMGNRYCGPEGPPQHSYHGLRPPGMGLSNMWTGMGQQDRPNGMGMQDPNMANQRNFSYGGVPPPVGHKPWGEAAGYPHPPPNVQYQMSAAVSSPQRPPAPNTDSAGRTRLASMLESPEMLALQQLSASSGPPACTPPQHIVNFQQPGPPPGIGSLPARPSQHHPPAPEVQLQHPARHNGPDSQPSQQTDTQPKGRPDLLLHCLRCARVDSPNCSNLFHRILFHRLRLLGLLISTTASPSPSSTPSPPLPFPALACLALLSRAVCNLIIIIFLSMWPIEYSWCRVCPGAG